MEKQFDVISRMIENFMDDKENKLYMVSATKRMGINMLELIHELTSEVEKILKYFVDHVEELKPMEIEVLQMKVHEMMNLLYEKIGQGERK